MVGKPPQYRPRGHTIGSQTLQAPCLLPPAPGAVLTPHPTPPSPRLHSPPLPSAALVPCVLRSHGSISPFTTPRSTSFVHSLNQCHSLGPIVEAEGAPRSLSGQPSPHRHYSVHLGSVGGACTLGWTCTLVHGCGWLFYFHPDEYVELEPLARAFWSG